jgi:asparagine synthase (glutamine-hydrolysing)
MSGICGWYGYGEAEAANTALLQRMSAPLRAHSAARFEAWASATAALACAGSSGATYFYRDANLCIALSGTPALRGAAQPGIDGPALAKAIAELVSTQGGAALAQIGGAFALCLIDSARARVLLAVDRNAVHNLAYTTAGNCLIFSTNQDSVNNHPLVSAEIDRQSIFNYVYFHMVPGARTIYQRQSRLGPGEYVEFAGGKLRTGKYWKNSFQEHDHGAFPQLKEQFLRTLRTGVREGAGAANCGAFLSGGTDSSTVAGLLTELQGSAAHTYSIGFSAQGYDEMEYAHIAVRHFNTDHHEYYVTADDIVTAVPLIAAMYDQPFGNSSAVPTYFCAKLAREDGRERILGGDGGDELFGGNERYARQRVFEHYHAIPSALRSALVEPATRLLPEALAPLRKLRSYVEQARVPMPRRLETYNLLERFGAEQVFEADFLHAIDRDEPVRLLEKAYHGSNAHSLVNKMLALDHQFTLADNDLPKVTKMCELAGIDAAFPLLHDDVVAFAAGLAPDLKLKGNKLRYFFKEALRGFLPDAIITKQKHGFGLPFGPWLQGHKGLQALVNDSLGSLAKRHIIRPALLRDLTAAKVAEHPGYYGTMVWVLMMLELWFQQHAAKR